MPLRPRLALPLCFALSACAGGPTPTDPAADENSFLDGEQAAGKFDTGWVSSLDAAEVEMDIEGDVVADSWSLQRAPLEVGQFALTYLRQRHRVFIQSLAEDYAKGAEQIEWLVDGKWVAWSSLTAAQRAKVSHYRLRAVSAVVMKPGDPAKLVGKVYSPTVPKKPYSVWSEVKDGCGDKEGSIEPSQDVYWYVWNPDKAACKVEKVAAKATVTKVLPKGGTLYPEYDRLLADKKVDALVIFGQVGHDHLDETDYAFTLIKSFESALAKAKFTKSPTAPIGRRWQRVRSGITETVDIYSPFEFAGLGDYAHIQNFDDGVNNHEIIVYNGHSMLGASDFWARPSIYKDPKKYQVFLYNGCLGYEYYVTPILAGKQGWENVDLVTNVMETPFAIMVQETANTLSMMFYGAERGGTTSWQSILTRMNDLSNANSTWGADGYYGASGVRTNLFKPRR